MSSFYQNQGTQCGNNQRRGRETKDPFIFTITWLWNCSCYFKVKELQHVAVDNLSWNLAEKGAPSLHFSCFSHFSFFSSGDGHIETVSEIWASEQLVEPRPDKLIDSSTSSSPPTAWPSLRHALSLWRKNITEGPDASPPHASQPDSPSTSPLPYLPKRERTAATMVLSQRQRDELWVLRCKYVVVQPH